MKKALLFLVFISLAKINSATIISDEELVNRIVYILVNNYDKKPANSILEKIIMAACKKNYIKMLEIWKKNHEDVYSVKFEIDPKIQKIINVVKKNLTDTESMDFENHVNELMLLTLLNFNLYFDAVKENIDNLALDDVSCAFIDECLTNQKFFYTQENLYKREIFLKNEIRNSMIDPRIKNKLEFELFFFDLINKIREQSIRQQLEVYYAKK